LVDTVSVSVALVLNSASIPAPAITHAILRHNHNRRDGLADGIVITPSHSAPEDGGFKYNSTNGGPADTDVTHRIEQRANTLLHEQTAGVKRMTFERAIGAETTTQADLMMPYVEDLRHVIDMDVIRDARLSLAVDPLGGTALHYWDPINLVYGLDIDIINPKVDATFSFMTVDHDGAIRMDCSGEYAMASLVGLNARYKVAFANDPDSDRHGIVTPNAGLMNPNHYLAIAIDYPLTHRPLWPSDAAVGKTIVSSEMVELVVQRHGRRLSEVPVGFKWFAPGLFDGSYCFGGEESAGASFVRLDGGVWTTDKDGPIMDLLAAEITACTGKDPGEHYRVLTGRFGEPCYLRIDAPAMPEKKARLANLSPEAVHGSSLAGEKITQTLTHAPGNGAPIGGLKVSTASGWFAARPSGTEASYKIYAESFRDEQHFQMLVDEAQLIVCDL
jgi:phosphoglucomutase